jgi:hypothetical protein
MNKLQKENTIIAVSIALIVSLIMGILLLVGHLCPVSEHSRAHIQCDQGNAYYHSMIEK